MVHYYIKSLLLIIVIALIPARLPAEGVSSRYFTSGSVVFTTGEIFSFRRESGSLADKTNYNFSLNPSYKIGAHYFFSDNIGAGASFSLEKYNSDRGDFNTNRNFTNYSISPSILTVFSFNQFLYPFVSPFFCYKYTETDKQQYVLKNKSVQGGASFGITFIVSSTVGVYISYSAAYVKEYLSYSMQGPQPPGPYINRSAGEYGIIHTIDLGLRFRIK